MWTNINSQPIIIMVLGLWQNVQLHQESDLNPVVLSDIGGIFTFAHSSGD